MTKQGGNKAHRCVRSIKTERGFEGAAAVVKRLADKTEIEAAAELHMQLMLKELDKFDPPEDDTDSNPSAGNDYQRLWRRWPDEISDRE